MPIDGAAETPGKDGAFTVSGSDVVVNEYSAVTGSLSPGQMSLSVVDLAGDLPSVEVGDLILIYQAQGALINQSDTTAYGGVTSLRSAGRYEYQTVGSISGNTINLENYNSNCGGLTYAYDASEVQVVRVPQYSTLTVPSGASLRAGPWNGQTGGVLAVHVEGTVQIDGIVSVSAQGFRGGVPDNLTSPSNAAIKPDGYRSTDAEDGAEKGESIAGFQTDYTQGRYGRGAPANGGGGGNGHNAGGGGGANGDNFLTWTGQGNPDLSTPSWAQAWDIDGLMTSTSVSSGGGRGGYSFGREGDALTLPPGDPGWTQGDGRRNVGGFGGRPLSFEPAGRLFFGGGGGAGDGNNDAAGAGGNGGGLVMIIAGSVTGSGVVRANGLGGADTIPRHNDAPGGGGGGGTIFIKTDNLSGVRLSASGGDGGDQLITNNENEGPGGGGGGGVIAFENGAPSSTNASAGDNGITTSTAMTEFPPNGATRGSIGQRNESAPSDEDLPFCRRPPTVLTGSKSVSVWDPLNEGKYLLPGEDVLYEIMISNPGGAPVDSGTIILTDIMPPELAFRNEPFGGSSPVEFIDSASGLSCCTGTEVSYSDTTAGVPVFGYTPTSGLDPNVTHIRVTPSGEMAPFSSFSVRFRAQIK